MQPRIHLALLALAATSLLAGCRSNDGNGNGGGAAQQGRCVTFESLAAGAHLAVPDTFSESGVDLRVAAFQWSNGTTTQNGHARVDVNGRAGGSGQDLNLNNATLVVDIGRVEGLTLRFGEYGGNVNLRINGEFRNFQNLSQVDGQTLGGVDVAVTGGFGNDLGTLVLDGVVERFSIGGQELWVDDVCVNTTQLGP